MRARAVSREAKRIPYEPSRWASSAKGRSFKHLATFVESLGDKKGDVLGVRAGGAEEDLSSRRELVERLETRPHALHNVADRQLLEDGRTVTWHRKQIPRVRGLAELAVRLTVTSVLL